MSKQFREKVNGLLNDQDNLMGQSREAPTEVGSDPLADWELPIPLGIAASLPKYPAHLLPGALRKWAQALAEANQVPLALSAALTLAVCAAGLSKKVSYKVRGG